MLQVGSLIFSAIFAYFGLQGMLGVPDRQGRVTSKPVAIILLLIAVALMVCALAVIPALMQEIYSSYPPPSET
jgi:hypothetical protein